ncbi:MAG: cytochrome c biogenesis heme-transporting ATPase CcmA [Steroidobacteraceae bacterium]
MLKDVSLDVRPGQLLHIAGPNGTGKTTLLRVACGLLRPEQGLVSWQGRSISAVSLEYQAALGYASHEPALKGDLTALENLRFSVGLKRRITARDLLASLDRTGVAACADLPARVLSAGQRRRVAMARILAMGASLWLLDEPFTNLDAAGMDLTAALLQSHVQRGGCALVVAHHALTIAVDMRRLELG